MVWGIWHRHVWHQNMTVQAHSDAWMSRDQSQRYYKGTQRQSLINDLYSLMMKKVTPYQTNQSSQLIFYITNESDYNTFIPCFMLDFVVKICTFWHFHARAWLNHLWPWNSFKAEQRTLVHTEISVSNPLKGISAYFYEALSDSSDHQCLLWAKTD